MSRCLGDTKDVKIIDFGEVEVGKTVTKSIKIMNESCKEQFYEAQRDPVTNPMDHVFNLKSYTWTLLPEQSFCCEIRYRPFAPCSKNVDYFIITGTASTYIKIIVRGTCIGPEIISSVNKVVLSCSRKNLQVKRQIKLSNRSKVKATYIFDIDREQTSFKLDVIQGVLDPGDYKYIIITFIPIEEGIYVYHLPCLILYQCPIIIKLYGLCMPVSHQNNINFEPNEFTVQAQDGFEEYMSDSINIKKGDLGQISLSKNYFDCGQADTNNDANKAHQTVCFTNHNKTDVLLKWDQDVTGIFRIEPHVAKVCPNHSALFEINFHPNEKNKLYTKQFIGYLFNEDARYKEEQNEFVGIPAFICIRVTGHSFPTNSAGWIPQYELPSTIVLPPCIPPFSVYTTFVIKKFGHLPLMFCFLPPADSHFIVKPMLGIIYEDYQVVVVQMCPEMMGEHVYMEQWAVCFNGNTKNKDYISFKGYAEYANVSFNNSIIKFTTVHLDTQQMKRILMRNSTRHVIMYHFLSVPSQLIIPHSKGQIHANDILSHEWIFHPKECGEYNFDVKCILIVTQNDVAVGTEVSITLHVTGRCEVGFLVAIPDKLDFDTQQYGDTKTKSLYVWNFSSVNIPFKIECCHQSWPIGSIERDIKIHPISETVLPGKSEKITISVTPYTPGFYEMTIKYFVRINSWTDNISVIQLPLTICKLYCMCELPTLKIKDIHFYGLCPSMNKVILWKIMEVNRLNAIFKNILPFEEETLHIYFQPMILHENPICIRLYITNPTSVLVLWDIKRMHLCSCKPICKSRGLSFRYMEMNCIHKKICSIYPQSGYLKSKEVTAINIELCYILLGTTEIKWNLNIGHERNIILHMQLEVLSGSEKVLHLLYEPTVKLENIYIGDKQPQHQICWIYNYTAQHLPYTVDIDVLNKINKIYHTEILACLNSHGTVQPQSHAPLILKFHPKHFETIEVTLPVTLGHKKVELMISGQPSIKYLPKITGEIMPNYYDLKLEEFPVYFSTDYVEVFTNTHSHVVKMLMMYNTSEHDRFTYKWISERVPELCIIKVHPKEGIIQPRTLQSLRVIIDTEGFAYKIDLNVTCEFLNVSKRRSLQRSIYKYNDACKELEAQFIITEKGESFPPLPQKPEGKLELCYKGLSIHCNIFSPEDIILRTKLTEELKMPPTNEIQIQRNTKSKNYENTEMILFILEGMIWDILNSRIFKCTIQEHAVNGLHLYYSQLLINPTERKKLVTKSYIAIPRKLIATILEKMLFLIIHEEFHLETAHLFQEKDIRHTSYSRMLPRKKLNLNKQGINELMDEDESYDTLKVNSTAVRISFSE
ncbi:hypothetical protein KPH14_008197 [Odynerus spinipes]|uniref:Cilia- and flagella-associated protein 65 n=1 Tax=Odynerus spinipes TaxID=1348599 RepID=A0AAD9VLR2_9HYME|nr:hypothetical protein KPH14_008197 [Odynerus spinipes]